MAAQRAKERAEKNKVLQDAFADRLKILQPLAWQQGKILIRPCAVPEELDQEHKALIHCVDTYKEKHAGGKTAIFFLRRASDPDKPWYTLELKLDDFTVIQNRGKCNCARTEEVEAFEKAWLEHIRPMKQQKKKGKGAA